jgi:hypothetical protein
MTGAEAVELAAQRAEGWRRGIDGMHFADMKWQGTWLDSENVSKAAAEEPSFLKEHG